jgi:predicted dehydrogenase
MPKEVTRRAFLASGAAAGLSASAFPSLRWFGGTSNLVEPDRKMNIACIGCGGKGSSDVSGVASENIVGLCDVDFGRANGSFSRFGKAKKYKDYRAMLTDMGDEIDAVTISTPDHTHFPAAMMAMQMGKHVFVQKPCAHTVWEARMMARAAKKYNVMTQMGNQGHANTGTRLIYEWIRSGAIGSVREVHLYTDRPIWPQNIPAPTDTPKVPNMLDWNLFLGTAPVRPYNGAYHPFKWRGWWDFGCGALGDMGCHIMDAAFWALDLGHGLEWIEAKSDAPDANTTPNWSIVTYQYGWRGDMPPVKVVWYDGKKLPPRPADLEFNRHLYGGSGQVFYGDKASIMANCYASSARIFPEKKMRAIGKPPKMVERIKGGHYQEWIRACKGGTPAGSNLVDHAGPLTEMVLLGNLAIRTGKRIHWDAEHMTCTGMPEADQYIRHPYRVF